MTVMAMEFLQLAAAAACFGVSVTALRIAFLAALKASHHG